ncbi:MAG: RNA recognition motif domain-containing protein [Neisseriaceae bacterium]
MKKALFVAGLDFSITDNDLKEIFSDYGTVESAKVVADRYSGQSRGFGFVEMSSQEEAQECIRNLNNTTVKNRQIVVKIKEDKEDKSNQRRNFSNRW